MKVMTVVGTRPELIRLSAVVRKLDRFFDHILVHTGQNYDYELNEVFFEDLGIRRPDWFLGCHGDTASQTVASVISEIDKILERESPDSVLILGDTNSAMAAYPAKRRQIPIFHMEAGNRCFDLRVPEEINRRVVDHLADINLPYSQIAREYLLAEGIAPDRVIVTGSPMPEVLDEQKDKINDSQALQNEGLTPDNYFLLSCHREENVDSPQRLMKLASTLEWMVKRYEIPVLFSCHPRTRKRLEEVGIEFSASIRVFKPFSFSDYIQLQLNARAVLSDSGTITEEASILAFKALNIRQSHERPEGMEEGAVMMVDFDEDEISAALEILSEQTSEAGRRSLKLVSDYETTNVSEKIIRIILSYTGYVRRVVWRRYGA